MFNTLTSFPLFSGFIGLFLINDSVLGFIHEVSFLAIIKIVTASLLLYLEKNFCHTLRGHYISNLSISQKETFENKKNNTL